MSKDINRLKVVLTEKNRSNRWLATQLWKDEGTAFKWCTNKMQPNFETLREMVLIFDVTELLWRTK